MKSLFKIIAIAAALGWVVQFGLPNAYAKKGPKPVITVDGQNAVKKRFSQAQSCQPTLVWENWFDSPASVHDVVIYAAYKSKATGATEVGEQIYEGQNISGNSFRVPQKLKPKSRYFWSFRQRIGGKAGPWATHNSAPGWNWISFNKFYFLDYPFGFKTPTECP